MSYTDLRAEISLLKQMITDQHYAFNAERDALRGRIADLENEHVDRLHAQLVAASNERAAIVAWLRAQDEEFYAEEADAIAAGAHHKRNPL